MRSSYAPRRPLLHLLVTVALTGVAFVMPFHGSGARTAKAATDLGTVVVTWDGEDGSPLEFSPSSISGKVGDTFTIQNATDLYLEPASDISTASISEDGSEQICDRGQATCAILSSMFPGANSKTYVIRSMSGGSAAIRFENAEDGESEPSGDLNFGGQSGQRLRKLVIDPNGGTCDGQSSPKVVRFKGTYVLPTSAECQRGGYRLIGWTRDLAKTTGSDLLTETVTGSGTIYAVWESGSPRITATKVDGVWIFDANQFGRTSPLYCGETQKVFSLTLTENCSETVNFGDTVVLKAWTGLTTKYLESWGGACAGQSTELGFDGLPKCTLTVTGSASVSATFADNRLSVTKTGTGNGEIGDVQPEIIPGSGFRFPSLIKCGDDCAEDYRVNQKVTLYAMPEPGSEFKSWGGACSGTPVTSFCVVTMDRAKSAEAEFVKGKLVTVDLNLRNFGFVYSLPVGPNSVLCGNFIGAVWDRCSVTYPADTDSVILYALANTGLRFASWGDSCADTPTTSACTLKFGERRDSMRAKATIDCGANYRSDFYVGGENYAPRTPTSVWIGPGAVVQDVLLQGTDLSRSCLLGASINGVCMTGVDLSNSNLAGASIRSSVLAKANLSGANIAGAKFEVVDVSGANLSGVSTASADQFLTVPFLPAVCR